MNIVYCFDENYRSMAKKSIESVLRYNPKAQILTIRKDYQGLLNQFGENLLGFKHVSKACFLRFLIPVEFPWMDRALYLDCDTVCNGDLSELYETDFDGKWFVGCEGHDYAKTQARELDLPWYVNSGVLLFNVPALLKANYLDLITEKYKTAIGKPRVFSGDETVLNWVFHDKIKLANHKFNYCHDRHYEGREIPPEKVVIWHVTGRDKRAMKDLLR